MKKTSDVVELREMLMLDKATFRLTEDGYLVVEPRIARMGIQIYKGWEVGRPDMEDVRVYRPEDEVFSTAALSSLAHRPITLDHPDDRVNAANWKKLAVGHSGDSVARDGDFIRVPMVLMDSAAIKAAQSGKSQLSVGYGAKLKWETGQTADGQFYDAVQQDIRANHIALVTKARGGNKLKIGDADDTKECPECGAMVPADAETCPKCGYEFDMSSEDAMPHPIKSEADLRKAIRVIGRTKDSAAKVHIKKRANALGLSKLIPASWGDSESKEEQSNRRKTMDRMLNVDGVTISLEDKDGQILERYLAEVRKQLVDSQAKLTEHQGQVGTLTAKLDELTKAIATKDGEIAALNKKVEDSKVTPTLLDEYCRKRMDVVERAIRVLGDKYIFDTKPDTVIRRDVVISVMGDQAAKEMSDDAIIGAFNVISRPSDLNDGNRRLAQSFSRPPAMSVSDAAATAYNKRNEELSNAWRKKSPTA